MGSASGRGRRWGGQMGDRIDGIDRSDGGRWALRARGVVLFENDRRAWGQPSIQPDNFLNFHGHGQRRGDR
jgi:hypothetical protein